MADNRGNRRGSASNRGTSVSSQGAEDLLALSKALKRAGQTGLRKELHKAMSNAAKPIIPKIKAAAEANLPKKGGINKVYGKKPYRAQTRTGEKTAGVRITGTKLDPRVDREGRVAHPVFGRPGTKVVQHIPGAQGYFSQTAMNEGPAVLGELRAVMEDFTQRLANLNSPPT